MGKHEIDEESTSPAEQWSDEGNDDGWPVEGIIGEEVNIYMATRYEVRWFGWQRKDETNTTWQKHISDLPHLVPRWKKTMADHWHSLAREDQTIRLKGQSLYPAHDMVNTELGEGRKQKAAKARHSTVNPYANWDTLEAPREAVHRQRESSGEIDARPIRPLPRRSRASTQTPTISSQSTRDASRQSPVPQPSKIEALQQKWNKVIHKAGAASIQIINEIDEDGNEDGIADLPDGFQYIESGYEYPHNIEEPDPAMLVGCQCSPICEHAFYCDCQKIADTASGSQDPRTRFFYTPSKLVTSDLPRGIEIIECNQNCSCSSTCRNRVAQVPRDIPLQIFKTPTHGWGVRAPVDIPKGKVLGYYTGELMHRKEAEALDGIEASYIFDLDGREDRDHNGDDADMFSVGAYFRGNWTRFVNHSCEPNMRIYCVVFDTIPEMNRPYHAFYALKDIPAFTELTIDYNPRYSESKNKGKVSPVEDLLEDAIQCLCGEDNCRGLIFSV